MVQIVFGVVTTMRIHVACFSEASFNCIISGFKRDLRIQLNLILSTASLVFAEVFIGVTG